MKTLGIHSGGMVLTERPEVLSPLLDLLGDEGFRREVESLGGYDASEMGRSVREG